MDGRVAAAASSSEAEQLRHAAGTGQADKVRELCKNGVKIDQDLGGRTALHLAAANGHFSTVKALVNGGAKVNARDSAGYSPLHQAATEGHEEIVALLLKSACHVDTQDELHGNTALHEAAWKGYSKTVETLCKNKANVYIKNNGGFTPLHLACQNGHNQSCRILLLAGCKPDVKNSYGDTPLHTAARYGHAGVLRILISAFCTASETNKNGDTALHISAAMGRRKLTKILMEAGCDQNIKNNQGETARNIAERKSFSAVVDILDNPPVTLIPVPQKEKKSEKSHKDSSKKHGKESGTSQESSTKDKSKKNKKKQTVHFFQDGIKKNISPYGCQMYPNLEFFPPINIKSLPPEPLKKGEQYYADLAGNIKKGPRGLGYVCYCAPFFDHVEKKLDANKQELLKHIHVKNEDLKSKMTHLEQKTKENLFNLNQRMKESFAMERAECSERIDRCFLRERIELQSAQQSNMISLKSEMKSWMNKNQFDEFHPQVKNGHCHLHVQDPISRSKSADLLSDTDSYHWDKFGISNIIRDRERLLANGHSVNVENHRHNVTDYSENSGAKPKHSRHQSPRLSRWKTRCYGNSILSRDSRSEGDLTSCHTEVTENKDKCLKSAKEMSCDINHSNSQLPQKTDIYHKIKADSPGILWNLKHLRNQGIVRTSHVHTEHESNPASLVVKHGVDRNLNDNHKQQLENSQLRTSENFPNESCSPQSLCINSSPSNAISVPRNLSYKIVSPHHTPSNDIKKENISQSISIEPDGSSFV